MIARAIYQHGRLPADALCRIVLAGSVSDLLASTQGAARNTAFYALEHRTPLKFAIIRGPLTTVPRGISARAAATLLGVDLR